jgi:hypothetical protein
MSKAAPSNINVIVINKAGKVGKSTISKHLIAPMLGADWIQVETFNDSGSGAKAMVAGRNFEFVAEAAVSATRSLCIDIGNSNYQAAMKELQEIDGFADRVQLWVVPCKESAGVMNDSLSTVLDLIKNLGVHPSRILVLPNDVESPEEGLVSFKKLALAATKYGFHFCTVAIPQNPKFDVFNADERSVMQIAADDTDYDAAIADETDFDQRDRLAQALILRGRARALAGKLNQVWLASPLASLAFV